jgi:hypothetical protein
VACTKTSHPSQTSVRRTSASARRQCTAAQRKRRLRSASRLGERLRRERAAEHTTYDAMNTKLRFHATIMKAMRQRKMGYVRCRRFMSVHENFSSFPIVISKCDRHCGCHPSLYLLPNPTIIQNSSLLPRTSLSACSRRSPSEKQLQSCRRRAGVAVTIRASSGRQRQPMVGKLFPLLQFFKRPQSTISFNFSQMYT